MSVESSLSDDLGVPGGGDPLVDRAVRLLTFLARAQQLRQQPVHDVHQYQRDGALHWFARFPEHDAVRWGDPQVPGDPVLSVQRLDRADPPEPPASVRPWVDGGVERAERPPRLRDTRVVGERWDEGRQETVATTEALADHPQVAQQAREWLAAWEAWAAVEQRDAPVRALYKDLFGARVSALQQAEERELVLGLGLLEWEPPEHPPVRRHLFTTAVDVVVDQRTGLLEVVPGEEVLGLRAELDMLDPRLVPTDDLPTLTESRAREVAGHPLDRAALDELGTATAFALHSQGRYRGEVEPAGITTTPTISWAPALVLRPRLRHGLVEAFEQIAAQILRSGRVPAGLRPLVDPDEVPAPQGDPAPGAVLHVGPEVFSPLPLNERQRAVIERVDRSAQTLVQGPPGTGKTHTAAALLPHLLAQGKRVLVTAHTDRALYEVRAKLPEQIRPLAVSVIGSSRTDMAQLRTAVDTISRHAGEHDAAAAAAEIEQQLRLVDRLASRRKVLGEALMDVRAVEVVTHEQHGYRGTLAAIARARAEQERRYGWVREHLDEAAASEPPVTGQEALDWLAMAGDERLQASRAQAGARVVDPATLPAPDELVAAAHVLADAQGRLGELDALAGHPAHQGLAGLGAAQRAEVAQALDAVQEYRRGLRRLREPWVAAAVDDILAGLGRVWVERAGRLRERLDAVAQRQELLGVDARVSVVGSPEPLVPMAQALRAHLEGGGEVRVNVDGSPKVGMFAPQVVRQCRSLLDRVRVNGVAPHTVELLDRFTAHHEAGWLLDEMDALWPAGTPVPAEDTLAERVARHEAHLHLLERVLGLHERVAGADGLTDALGLPGVDWADDADVQQYRALAEAVAVGEEHRRAAEPLDELAGRLAEVARWGDAAGWVAPMLAAVRDGDHDGYARAHARALEEHRLVARLAEHDRLAELLASWSPSLVGAVEASPHDPVWEQRLAELTEAARWVLVGRWLREQETDDANAIQQQVDAVEEEIRAAAEVIAAQRAWSHAVGPGRLTPQARADLTQYSQLVKRLGKGTGRYAAQQRVEIRRALESCRESVPVWIMPIHRVVEQLPMVEDMFDVVVVDEASQAGLGATFLQYLAPRIVVIGDDKQVSPTVITEQQPLIDLADQYLFDDRYKASWQDPGRSLFDEAKMRYGGLITLVEHRRCVPEIIGFSNRIAYEPENIRLQPVRQVGADRLEPIRLVHLPEGHEAGPTGSKVNEAEARALVDALLACHADPAYEGASFGVISLLGATQAKLIEGMLLAELDAQAWEGRDLRVGTAAEFQGAERDVMFLSMVSSPEPGRRTAALTREMYVQRYNVAVSRAKDQVWIFHSIRPEDLSSEEDVRYQLLDYARTVVGQDRSPEGAGSPPVPDDERVPGFDSLFEQRVYNRIADRGYTVLTQQVALGFRIDLVVVGARARLAVECDGDHWHGPDRYEADLARQRELERCGWQFFRVRESAFYVDPARALEGLWEQLERLGIRPAGAGEPAGVPLA